MIFTTLDLKNGFFHVSMDEDTRSIKYTAFVTPNGHYEFLKTPFALCTAPSMFQRFINFVFHFFFFVFFDIVSKKGYMLVYMDDLIIISNTIEENIRRLEIVLKTVADHGLNIKWKKCKFLKKQIDYLGYRIEHNKLYQSPSKMFPGNISRCTEFYLVPRESRTFDQRTRTTYETYRLYAT